MYYLLMWNAVVHKVIAGPCKGSNLYGNWNVVFLDNSAATRRLKAEINTSEWRWPIQQYNITLYKHFMKGTTKTKTKEQWLHRANNDTSNVYKPTNQRLGSEDLQAWLKAKYWPLAVMTTGRKSDGTAFSSRTSSVARLQAHVRTQASSVPEEDLPEGGAVLCYCTEQYIEYAALFVFHMHQHVSVTIHVTSGHCRCRLNLDTLKLIL
jgi:hypothetical protein